MKLISNWIEDHFAQRSEISDTAESIEPKLCVQTPKNFAGDPTPTLPVLTSLDASFFEVAESNGFDPYNSGSFVTSKSRSGK
jgi:hypothetical protein